MMVMMGSWWDANYLSSSFASYISKMAFPSTLSDIQLLTSAFFLTRVSFGLARESPFHARWPIHAAISIYSLYNDRHGKPLGTIAINYSLAL